METKKRRKLGLIPTKRLTDTLARYIKVEHGVIVLQREVTW